MTEHPVVVIEHLESMPCPHNAEENSISSGKLENSQAVDSIPSARIKTEQGTNLELAGNPAQGRDGHGEGANSQEAYQGRDLHAHFDIGETEDESDTTFGTNAQMKSDGAAKEQGCLILANQPAITSEKNNEGPLQPSQNTAMPVEQNHREKDAMMRNGKTPTYGAMVSKQEQKYPKATEDKSKADYLGNKETDIHDNTDPNCPDNRELVDPEDEIDTKCGYGPCKPHWLQRFNTPFTLLMCILFYMVFNGKVNEQI